MPTAIVRYDGHKTTAYVDGVEVSGELSYRHFYPGFQVRHQELKDCDVVFKERPRPKWKSRAGKGKKVRRV